MIFILNREKYRANEFRLFKDTFKFLIKENRRNNIGSYRGSPLTTGKGSFTVGNIQIIRIDKSLKKIHNHQLCNMKIIEDSMV